LLRTQGVPLVDCQQETAHLRTFGARPIARAAFAMQLSELIHSTEPVAGWRAGTFEASEIELR
jgi:leucyl/phenylalanyl-tRNA--protein transferase